MKHQKSLIVALALLLGASAASAWEHGPRARVGVYIGGPVWGPAWYPGPYYYPPQVVVVPPPAQPPVYIEQSAPAPAPAAQQYWYYCTSAKGYYPYVKECPEGWQRVLPQPEQ